MFAQAVVPVEIVADESVHAATDALTHPRLEHLFPGRITQTGPVLRHAPDGVSAVGDGRAIGILLEQLQRVRHGLGTEHLFVPQIAIELEEAARAVGPRGIANEKLDVEMSDDFDAPLVELVVELFKPLP